MNLFEVQLIVLFLLLIGTFICGILPILCFRCLNCFSGGRSSNKVTSSLIFFGGGVLFATSMLHLLPEAREQLEKVPHHFSAGSHHSSNSTSCPLGKCNSSDSHHHSRSDGHKHGFSFPEFITLCGFFATYLIEEIIRSILKGKTENGISEEDRIKFCSCAQRNTECSRTYKDLRLDCNDLLAADYRKRKRSSTWAGQENNGVGVACGIVSYDAPPDLLKSTIISQPYPNYGATEDAGPAGLPMRVGGGITLVNHPVDALCPQNPGDAPEILVVPASPPPERTLATTISIGSLLTVAALSFHSVFEGIVMGFQPTASATWTSFFAVALHKFVIAFVIGVEAVVEKSGSTFVLACMTVFSIMSPVGIGIAMSLGGGAVRSTISQYVVGIVNCLATGTLLYVTFFEILRRKCHNICGCQRFLATISGFLLMSGLLYATTEL